jgi:hypothetical protein
MQVWRVSRGLPRDCAAGSPVGESGGGVDFAKDAGGDRGPEAAGVHAGELESIEDRGGSSGFELAGGEGVDDHGEGELDGVAVFQGEELDMLARDEVAGGERSAAEGSVAVVEVLVVEAEVACGKCGGAALGSALVDAAAEWVGHEISLGVGGWPPVNE